MSLSIVLLFILSLTLFFLISRVLDLRRLYVELKRENRMLKDRLKERNLLVFTLDRGGCYTQIEGEVQDILGYSKEDLLGLTLQEIVHPTRREEIESILKGSTAYDSPFLTRIRHKDGYYLYMESSLKPLLHEEEETETFQGLLSYSRCYREELEDLLTKNRDFLLLLDNIETLIWHLLDEETYGITNKAHADFLHTTKEDLEGKTLWDLFSKEEAILCIEGNRQVFEEKRQVKSEEWVEMGDGEMALLSITKTPRLNEDMEVEYVICSAQDITDKWRVQERLRQSEERLLAIIQDQTELICRFLPGGLLTFVNEAYCKYFKKRREDLLGKSFIPLIPEEDQGISERHVSSLSIENPVCHYEHRVILPGGIIRWQQWTDRAIFNHKNEIVEYQAVGRDITQQKEAQEALKKAHSQLEERVQERTEEILKVNQALRREIREHKKTEEMLAAEKELLSITLRSIGDGVITTNTDGMIEMINERALRITGWTHEEAIGKELREVLSVSGEGRDDLFSTSKGDDHGGSKRDKVLLRKDGKLRSIFERSAPIGDRENSILGYVVVFSDITEKKRYDEKRALSQKLESIGQLAAGIAHEINTPLHYIQENISFLQDSFLELNTSLKECTCMKDREDDLRFLREEVPKALSETREGISRMDGIIVAMKDFAHPGQRKMSPFDLNRAIESTVNISRNEWKHVAEMDLKLDPDLPPILCTLNELNQAILNLIINAIQALSEDDRGEGEGKGRITITTKALEESVEMTISDTGPGISQENLHRIFDPFYTTKEVGKGTGQGLAITYDIIVNKHGGEIQVDSTPGQGATFKVILPQSL